LFGGRTGPDVGLHAEHHRRRVAIVRVAEDAVDPVQCGGFASRVLTDAKGRLGGCLEQRRIKNGSSGCDDAYFAVRLSDFEMFADPLVYMPGDNEWTDCHRANNGGYLPTERLAALRELFFAKPDRTLGGMARVRVRVRSREYPSNAM
jgi:hypothetical protein